MTESRSQKAVFYLQKIQETAGSDGLPGLRSLYPGSRFAWTESHGLATFWNYRDGDPPTSVMIHSGYVENLASGEVKKNRDFYLVPDVDIEDLDVVRVMSS